MHFRLDTYLHDNNALSQWSLSKRLDGFMRQSPCICGGTDAWLVNLPATMRTFTIASTLQHPERVEDCRDIFGQQMKFTPRWFCSTLNGSKVTETSTGQRNLYSVAMLQHPCTGRKSLKP
jgi:hypothetical protein